MNPSFIVLMIIVCIAVWFLSSVLYKPIGKFIYKIYEDAIDSMTEESEDNKE